MKRLCSVRYGAGEPSSIRLVFWGKIMSRFKEVVALFNKKSWFCHSSFVIR